jgi:ABC-type branched-subunit amino acid transport system substrate-binding protein
MVLVGQGGPLGAALEDLAPEWEAGNPNWRFASVATDSADWRSDVLARSPAVVLCDLDPVRAGEVVAELRQEGWSGGVLGGPALASSDFAAVAGRAAQGAEFVTPWPFPRDVPGGDAFAAAYRGLSDGVEPGILAIPTYEAMWILVGALERAAAAEEPTRGTVAAALTGVEREGMLGPLVFDEGNGWSGDALYWYHIGPDGAPSLVERVSWPAGASWTRPPRTGEGG